MTQNAKRPKSVLVELFVLNIYLISIGLCSQHKVKKMHRVKWALVFAYDTHVESKRGKLQACPPKPVVALFSLKVAWSGNSLITHREVLTCSRQSDPSSWLITPRGALGGSSRSSLGGLFVHS